MSSVSQVISYLDRLMVDGCSIDMIMAKIWGVSSEALPVVCSAHRVGFFNNGSGRVLDKKTGSGSG